MQMALARISDLSQPRVVADWLSEQLVAQAPTGKRRESWLAGRVLLAQLTGQRPLATLFVQPSGKPAFICPQLPRFNISHSGDFIFVAVVNEDEVGCDIELVRERRGCLNIAQQVFSDPEYVWLLAQPLARQSAAFWRLWTVREAVLKQRGASVWQMEKLMIDPVTLTTPKLDLYHWCEQGVSIAVVVHERSIFNQPKNNI